MARKSNKTEHVLKLITKNEDDTDDIFFVMEQDPKENYKTEDHNTDEPEPEEATPRVDVALKPAKKQKLKYETKLKIEIEPEIELKPKENKEPEESREPGTVHREKAIGEPKDKEPADYGVENSEPQNKEAADHAAEDSEPQKNEIITADMSPGKSYGFFMGQDKHPVNLAEILACEKLELVMERMRVCTCPTCVNDVLALALNSLPAKYVTDAEKLGLQLELYKKEYETDILAALTKSCVRVKAVPRHKMG